MDYWIAYRFVDGKKQYIAAVDSGHIQHVQEEENALIFRDYDEAMSYFARGYTLQKKND